MCVALVAILLLALRPFRVPGWVWPIAGALALVLSGVEPLGTAAHAVERQWNVLLFILGLMGVSAAAEESGAYAWIADFVLHRARGSRRRLFVLLYTACAIVTLLLSNDATAIALTPIVYRAVSERARADATPFLFACIFVANAGSFGLPFSNPANVLILPHPQLLAYLAHLGPPQIAVIVATLGIFLFFYRDRLEGEFDPVALSALDRRTITALFALGSVVAAYILALIFQWPLGPVALLGAIFCLAISRASLRRTAGLISWKTLVLLVGLFVLIDAVARAGFVSLALVEFDRSLRFGDLVATAVAAGGAGLLSNVFNNLPVAVAASYVVAHATAQQTAYPLIAGVDTGPNLLTSGSLATILWLALLRRHGIRVSLAEYLRVGLLVVPSSIAICVLWLSFIDRFL
jgi:arsenical pump membrane protein